VKDPILEAPALLDKLYETTTHPEQWTVFLEKIAKLFRSDTAALRLTDLNDPVVYRSYTIGFHQNINTLYESTAVEQDPFREALAASVMGSVIQSRSVISDRDFEWSEHYQGIFRPNGNFYAMGAQFDRQDGRAMHIGIHRPQNRGHFCEQELAALELFSPHLRRATRLSRLFSDLNQELDETKQALNHLPFGVWRMDHRLHVKWLNRSAEEALAEHTYGLSLQNNRLRTCAGIGAIQAMADQLTSGHSVVETLRLDQSGACLVMMQSCRSEAGFHIGRGQSSRLLCFLLDPKRPSQLNRDQLVAVYQLTPAECRLADLLVRGLDVNEASTLLQISPHTGRTQLKSIMRKTGVRRQTTLQRSLLLCSDTLRLSANE
jgi:DNA-binding CsgD family transcriptional regulator/PAS domain-containing protein